MNSFITSFKKNYKGILFIIIASLLTSLGQLLWKLSNGQSLNFLISGFFLYGIGAVLMIIAFRYGSLSVIHPMLSFGYIFAIILGNIVLKESITIYQYLGIFIIILGVILIGGGDD
ncbi:membrane protein [Clostridium polyendosporum]|uniref:Membrane protein n=1 Tax=Clostridium polyendosporum TaxID=69208 RepID=A0A919RZ99_9CLOT|nr:EamA family transporter [Clostridium polyendosporum]GIM28240.1 membrane protein [Clostridium polyendosporum]